MFRMVKYALVVVPLVTKFVKSPTGQKTVSRLKSRFGKNGTGTGGR